MSPISVECAECSGEYDPPAEGPEDHDSNFEIPESIIVQCHSADAEAEEGD